MTPPNGNIAKIMVGVAVILMAGAVIGTIALGREVAVVRNDVENEKEKLLEVKCRQDLAISCLGDIKGDIREIKTILERMDKETPKVGKE